jgi:hypothetical protein
LPLVLNGTEAYRFAHAGPQPSRAAPPVTRDEAIRAGIFALAQWHERQHGKFCPCSEGDRFGEQAAALVDGLAAEGILFEGFVAISPDGLGPQQV